MKISLLHPSDISQEICLPQLSKDMSRPFAVVFVLRFSHLPMLLQEQLGVKQVQVHGNWLFRRLMMG